MKLQTTLTLILSISLTLCATLHGQETATQPAQQVTTPVPVQSVVVLAPTNSRISFVGIHVGEEPKPRLGGFTEFQGHVTADPAKNTIESVVIDIKIGSVWTEWEKLTGHLQAPDFFDAAKFPKAKFVSTQISTTEQGKCTITGDLTLHGTTKSISFPVNYRFDAGGLLMAGKFNLDRSQFGMVGMLSGVEKLVEVEIYVGQETKPLMAKPGHGSVLPKNKLQQVALNLPNME